MQRKRGTANAKAEAKVQPKPKEAKKEEGPKPVRDILEYITAKSNKLGTDRVMSDEKMERHEARRNDIIVKINAWAAAAMERWRLKLLAHNAEHCTLEGEGRPVDDAKKPWMLCVGPSHNAKGCGLRRGSALGAVLPHPNQESGWKLDQYNYKYDAAVPALFYAEKADHLWPGDPRDNFLDCAILMAAGVRFDVRHVSGGLPISPYDIARDADDRIEWASVQYYKSAFFWVKDEKSLVAAIQGISRKILEERKKASLKRAIDLAKKIQTFRTEIDSVTELNKSFPVFGPSLV
jgi:hypothetical protein